MKRTKISDDELRRRYVEARESSEAIGASLGVSGRTVRNWLSAIGLGDAMRRRKSEANIGRKPSNYSRLSDNPKQGRRYVNRDGRVVPYARWLMEQHLGRPIAETEHVHHIDENPLNDVIENLTVISAADHCRHHRPVTARWKRRRKD